MEDARIIELYWARDERAITESQRSYGNYCKAIAKRILRSEEDASECLNDTWFGAWNAIPPSRPNILSAFLGKITRNLSLKKLRAETAAKRGGGEAELTLDELSECIPAAGGVEDSILAAELAETINRFLAELPKEERQIFMCRYFYFDQVKEIADRFGLGESKVKMTLKRTRDKLLVHLEKEGVPV